ncbi:DUF3299 domain-containing protein [Hahella aquimaris]|uniref:DUF3299 domain-containing protein n=1 Tax=Hahella sp. HNIBRBA332 TaxID=3015983 RepID=UPI00273CDC44|nr:DUF3299 domain-containing protein [Hahella sp. HNIBRBA332]WLQ12553.1 DUF3299 domain-containing protein [Hahella sp. HNIBRBA332]
MNRLLSTLIALAFSSLLSGGVLAEDFKTVQWQDLIPKSAQQKTVSGTVEHGQIAMEPQPQANAPIVPELNKQKVRIAGFAVPLEGDESGVTEFLLVPYMGACIHVPPPPSNQIVYVKANKKPLPLDYLYDAFWVSGAISVETVSSELAESGYSMQADAFEPYQYN